MVPYWVGPLGAGVSDILREIEDELRRDNLLKLWGRYGKYVIAVVILAGLGVAGFVGWRDHQATLRQAEGAQYSGALALARAGKDADAAKDFAALAQQSGSNGYGLPAALQEAELAAHSGDNKGAIAIYDKLAATPGIDPEFRDLAVLLSVMHGFPYADPKTAVTRLAPLTESGSPLRASALDLTAAAKLEAGDRAGALAIYQKIADDLAAPQALRARAAELVAALKS